ncbi:(E)-4-hydroxy-3-methylbut-2-enyl-diphosphate synthase [Luteibaculum oceani]|uniref:4-hydroxy-3-methylbut-2-en-1-yl diphosphate synthase (flavodoxin) n=1 Tax=Luteibaculum oceani TaxID=1294296 RepID=A0A5C6VJR0_9FLAO|nr:(E)-4-hydroxy-3-methylbut-2-enyl-diphosphate synthase [Luteibaculum oceani]TXC85099.1 (E)-4-hydroxy-3-methylbut-2-enyl-diphosphate synthase [Luteibaculum oceani]
MKDFTPHTYCESLTTYKRLSTLEVTVGSVKIGGNNPIRLQSMTTTDTMNTKETVEQSVRMIEAGCELVRITAPSKKEAQNLLEIKNALRAMGHDTPLVADIHFTPNAAEVAAQIVEKVRINPGNFVDKKKFEFIEYTDDSYQEELNRIEKKFVPLVELCKKHNTAMRIGTNHGSLSDRILSRFGDTPEGMVESALEFLRIAKRMDYHNIVLSMKASNTLVMVQAYRLLVNKMHAEGMNYPLHLGVTEAGDGEDGRIKSAVGIGALLEDGLGDTIRVSLTEEPEAEIPVAAKLAASYKNRIDRSLPDISDWYNINPYAYQKSESKDLGWIGGGNHPVVLSDLSDRDQIKPASLFPVGYNYSVPLDKWNIMSMAVDAVYIGKNNLDFEIPGTLHVLQDVEVWEQKERVHPVIDFNQLTERSLPSTEVFVKISDTQVFENDDYSVLPDRAVIVLSSAVEEGQSLRAAFLKLRSNSKAPIIIQVGDKRAEKEDVQLYASARAGLLLIDGLGDGLFLDAPKIPLKDKMETCFGILQATRTRISKTEYISCPSCGRTLFDLQETTAKIRKVTNHLKGVKIGIMGCIVNGPGEMADADYGYVGTGPGKITLYKEKEVVTRNVPEEEAVDALIDLIKTHGDWKEPEAV